MMQDENRAKLDLEWEEKRWQHEKELADHKGQVDQETARKNAEYQKDLTDHVEYAKRETLKVERDNNIAVAKEQTTLVRAQIDLKKVQGANEIAVAKEQTIQKKVEGENKIALVKAEGENLDKQIKLKQLELAQSGSGKRAAEDISAEESDSPEFSAVTPQGKRRRRSSTSTCSTRKAPSTPQSARKTGSRIAKRTPTTPSWGRKSSGW